MASKKLGTFLGSKGNEVNSPKIDLNKVRPGQIVELTVGGTTYRLLKPRNAIAVAPDSTWQGHERTAVHFFLYTDSFQEGTMVVPCRYIEVGKLWWDGEHELFVGAMGGVAPAFFTDDALNAQEEDMPN